MNRAHKNNSTIEKFFFFSFELEGGGVVVRLSLCKTAASDGPIDNPPNDIYYLLFYMHITL